MNKKLPLRNYTLNQVKNPSETEIEAILSIFTPCSCEKNELLIQPDDRKRYLGFFDKGSIRNIYYKEDGTEVTTSIMDDHDFFGSLEGLDIPTGVQCLENFQVLIASVEEFEKLLETNLTLNILIRKYMSRKLLELAEKNFMNIAMSSKERYETILKKQPELVQKYPLRFVASMIGVTPTQLSRVRKIKD